MLILWQECRSKSLYTPKVQVPKKQSHADTVITCPLLANSWNPAVAIVLPQLKHQKTTLLNKLTRCDYAAPAIVCPLPKCSRDWKIEQCKASGIQFISTYKMATVQIAYRLMKAIVFTKTPWPILSNEKCTMVAEACKLAFEAHNHQCPFPATPVCVPFPCWLPRGLSVNIDLQGHDAVSLQCYLVLLLSELQDWPCQKIYRVKSDD